MKKVMVAICILAMSLTAFAEHSLGKAMDDKLVNSEGKSHKSDLAKKKYIVFYYSASWCGPCKKFSPQLVEFYKKSKKENFELVLVSSDRSEKAMYAYMKSAGMTFPAVNFNDRGMARKYAGRGIPWMAMVDEKVVISTLDLCEILCLAWGIQCKKTGKQTDCNL